MNAARAGGNRQELHEIIRQHSLNAWEALNQGQPNPLIDALCDDAHINSLLPTERIRELMQAEVYVGDAPERARALASRIRETIS